MLDMKKGTRRAGNVVNLAVAGIANAQPIFQQSNWPNQIGTKTFRIKRLKVRNNAAGTQFLHIGTGAGAGVFVDRIPPLVTVNNLTDDWVEDDLPEYVFTADCTAYPAALLAGGSLDVQVEVEEIG
jgi:hypothetical protein